MIPDDGRAAAAAAKKYPGKINGGEITSATIRSAQKKNLLNKLKKTSMIAYGNLLVVVSSAATSIFGKTVARLWSRLL